MEPVFFYKELLAHENNDVFTANISEKNEVENVKFRKSQEYGIRSMSIKPDIDNSFLVKVFDESKLKFLSKKIQELVKTKIEPDLNLKISHSETKDVINPFQKKSEKNCPHIKLFFYISTTTKNEEIIFGNYYKHLKKFGFKWENATIDFKFSIKLSTDKKKTDKKMRMSKGARSRIQFDESRIWAAQT